MSAMDADSYFLHLDESYKGRLIAVGGFICSSADLPTVLSAWIATRQTMGLKPDEPLKWNFSQNSAVRKRLDQAGMPNQERRRLMCDTIRAAPVMLLADVIYDAREGGRPTLDFYRFALDWLVLRFRNHLTDMAPAPSGPHVVVLDQPSPTSPNRPDQPQYNWLADRETIWYHVYRNAYQNGWVFDNGKCVCPLSENGFYPSVVVSHAKFDPLLEVADAVAGLSLDFAYYNLLSAQGDALPEPGWQDKQFLSVAGKFRAAPNRDILNWGYAVFPRSAPAFATFTGWITSLITDPRFDNLRLLLASSDMRSRRRS